MEAGRGLGVGVWGHVIGLGDIWRLWINETHPLAQAGSQAAPRKEHASPSGLSAICQGTGQLPFELKGKPGREIPNHKAGEKVGSGTGVTWGPVWKEWYLMGRQLMGRAPWGKPLTSGRQLVGKPAGWYCRDGWDLRCERERTGVPEALPCRDRAL